MGNSRVTEHSLSCPHIPLRSLRVPWNETTQDCKAAGRRANANPPVDGHVVLGRLGCGLVRAVQLLHGVLQLNLQEEIIALLRRAKFTSTYKGLRLLLVL